MVLAIIDGLQYLTLTGKYSKVKLLCNGAFIADASAVKKIENVEFGTMFFHTRLSFFSWLIMYFTNGPWSHAATILDGRVLHAVTSGVVENAPSDMCDGKSYLSIIEFPISSCDKSKVAEFYDKQLGKKYNWIGVLGLLVSSLIGKDANGYPYKFVIDVFITSGLAIWFFR